MRILIDIDGVVADLNEAAASRLELRGSETARLAAHMRSARGWSFTKGLPKKDAALILGVLAEPGFYADLPVIPGARAALAGMRDAGHDVFFVTSPWLSNPTCASDKLGWVERHFGLVMAYRTVIAGDKTVVTGDFLVDDKPDITGCAAPSWTQVFYTRPWNLHKEGPRIHTWGDDSWRRVLEHKQTAAKDMV